MGFLFHTATFNLPGNVGVPGDQAITGVGFEPTLLLAYDIAGVFGGGFVADYESFYGAASSSSTSNQRRFGITSFDAEGVSDVDTLYATNAFWADPGANGTLKSFDSDGFTLHWDASTPNAPVNYLAFGGDVAETEVGDFTVGNGVTGDYTVNGVGFVPDLVMLISTRTLPGSALEIHTRSEYSFGTFNGVGEQFAVYNGIAASADTMNTNRALMTNKCVFMNRSNADGTNTTEQEAAFVGMDSDGFTLNFSTVPSSELQRIIYIALRGPATKIGSITSPTVGAPPVQQQTTGLGLDPRMLLFLSVCGTSSSSRQDHARVSVGCASALDSRWARWLGDKDAVGTSQSAAKSFTDRVINISTEASSAGSSTTQATADINNFDTGGFTLDWDIIDGSNAYEIAYIAFADAQAPPPILTVQSTTLQPQSIDTLSATNAESEGSTTVHY